MTRQLSQASIFLLISGCCGNCCPDPFDTGKDTAPVVVDTGDDDSGDDDDSGEEEPTGVHGTIEGTVNVQLFELDDNDDLVYLAWEDSCFGDVFPYGSIFVAAYSTDEETGVETYYTEDVIAAPSCDSSENTYSLAVDTDLVDEVNVYAVLDKWGDRIIGATDPLGIYGDPIAMEDGETVSDVNVEIVTQYWCGEGSCPDCPPSWGDGSCWSWDGSAWVYICSGGGSCDAMTLAGDLFVEVPYNGTGSDAATMLMLPGSGEPYYAQLDLGLTATADGAEGTWGYSLCQNSGTFDARGCWDSNGNLLYDPDDTWGQVVDAFGAPQGTVTIGTEDLLDQTMVIPIEGSEIEIVPFVRLSGDVSLNDGDFDDLLAEYPEATLYVTVLKYMPSGDIAVDELEQAYDYLSWGPDDLAGQSSVSYSVMAPGNTTVYLWANVDLDADGTLNESEDPVGCPGESCRISTGDASQTDLDIGLQSYSSE